MKDTGIREDVKVERKVYEELVLRSGLFRCLENDLLEALSMYLPKASPALSNANRAVMAIDVLKRENFSLKQRLSLFEQVNVSKSPDGNKTA